MKNRCLTVLLVLVSLSAFSEDNKPHRAFGIGYGIGFNGSLAQNIKFSYWDKNNIEYGSSLSFSFSVVNNHATDSVQILTRSNGRINALRQTNTYYNTFGVGVSPFIVYHFPFHSPLDFYIGATLPVGFNPNLKRINNTEITSVNYYYKATNESKTPNAYNVGLQLLAGSNFFFYKNFALGAFFTAGAGTAFTKGSSHQKTTTTNSGSNNPNYGTNVTNYTSSNVFNTTFTAAFTGSAVLTLSYYFDKKKKVSLDMKE